MPRTPRHRPTARSVRRGRSSSGSRVPGRPGPSRPGGGSRSTSSWQGAGFIADVGAHPPKYERRTALAMMGRSGEPSGGLRSRVSDAHRCLVAHVPDPSDRRHNPTDGGHRPERGRPHDRADHPCRLPRRRWARPARPWPPSRAARIAVASVGRRCLTSSSTSACRRCARASCAADQLDRDGAVLSAPRLVCDAASSCSSPSTCAPEDDLHRVRLLLVVLGQLGRHARRYAER